MLMLNLFKIPQLIKQKSNNFYVILQTILREEFYQTTKLQIRTIVCVYYVPEIRTI